MPISRSLPRYKGTTKKLDFPERPSCKYCKISMKIVKTTKPMVGLHENYHVQNVYYQCGQALCKGETSRIERQKILLILPKVIMITKYTQKPFSNSD